MIMTFKSFSALFYVLAINAHGHSTRNNDKVVYSLCGRMQLSYSEHSKNMSVDNSELVGEGHRDQVTYYGCQGCNQDIWDALTTD